MIAGIRGRVAGFAAATVYIDVGGLEYEVYVPLNVFESLQKLGPEEEARLFTHHHFMQDEQRLYGFLDRGQRDLFVAVKNIKGLGTALTLSLLSHLDGPTLLRLCREKDMKALTRIPRVGKSTAETIVFEIGRKAEKWEKIIARAGSETSAGADAEDMGGEEELAFQALLQLGYKEKEARESLLKLRKTRGSSSASELIRQALLHL